MTNIVLVTKSNHPFPEKHRMLKLIHGPEASSLSGLVASSNRIAERPAVRAALEAEGVTA